MNQADALNKQRTARRGGRGGPSGSYPQPLSSFRYIVTGAVAAKLVT